MKVISISDLKRHLSRVIAEAGAGEPYVITRHHVPVAEISGAELRHLLVGDDPEGVIEPVLKGPTEGRYLAHLVEDRRGGPDR